MELKSSIPRIKQGGNVQTLRTSKQISRAEKEFVMGAKWNWLIDNTVLRGAINTTVLVMWFWTAFGILEFAAKF